MNTAVPEPLIGFGQIGHTRLRPARNSFNYRTYFLMLPMRRLRREPSSALRRNRFGLVTFHDRDHGDGREDSLAWLEELLRTEGITDADGEVWLHCYPRVLGHTFKPVSFWYCHRADDSLSAIVVEVNNTFGERHCYLLQGRQLAFGQEIKADKVFHVSPFCSVTGNYRFRFLRTGLHPEGGDVRKQTQRTVVRIDHDDEQGPLLQTSVSGWLEPLGRASILRAFLGMPLMTVFVVARIHWQAIRLWAKHVPFLHKPEAPRAFTTR
jgi:DUF1365 family protein